MLAEIEVDFQKSVENLEKLLKRPTNDYLNFLSIVTTPSNRSQVILKPIKEFHNQTGIAPYKFIKPQYLTLDTPILLLSEQLLRTRSSSLVNFWYWLLLDAYGLIVDVYLNSDEETDQPLAELLASHPNCNGEKLDRQRVTPKPKKFTRKGRQTILDAAGALEKEGYKPEDFYFFTGTLPGSTVEAMETLACYTREIVNTTKQALRRLGLKITFNTWEWQKRGALHLHLVVYCPIQEIAETLPQFFKDNWLNLMDSITTKSGVDMYQRIRGGRWNRLSKSVQEYATKTIRCEKSVAAYLSKYVGKNSLVADKQMIGFTKKKNTKFFYPSSWWSISNCLRKLIKKHTYSFSVCLPAEKIETVRQDIVALLEGAATLVLKPFSPEGYPDYIYQSIYIKEELYEDVQYLLGMAFADPEMKDVDPEWSRISSLGSMLEKWFKLPKNHNIYSKFEHTFSYYVSRSGLDWNSKTVIEKAFKWVKHYCSNQEWRFSHGSN